MVPVTRPRLISTAAVLASLAATGAQGSQVVRSGSNVAASSGLPLTEVVKLLSDMQKELEQEAKEDQETYEKLQCWCTKNKADKTKAVEDAQNTIDELMSKMEAASGKVGSLTTSIAQAKQDIAEGEKALAEATEIRKKEAAAFHDQETDLLQSVELLKGAITALSKHHASMLQADESEAAEVARLRPALRKVVHRHLNLLDFLQGDSDKEALLNFLQANADILEPDATNLAPEPALVQKAVTKKTSLRLPYKSYTPQSGQVLGVLRQMKEKFEENLPEIQKDESAKAAAFAELKGSKEAELKQLRESVDSQTEELAANKEALANAKYDLEDTRASMSADQKFMIEIVETCTNGDNEWKKRSKMRADEITAVAEAISILSADEVKDGQQKLWGFLQTASTERETALSRLRAKDKGFLARRAKAVAFLQKAVVQAPMLAALLATAQTDPFDKVIKAIESLSEKLKIEQADEVKHRDYCVDSLHENEVQTERKNAESEGLATKIEDLAAQAKAISDELTTLKQEIADLQIEMQRATETRKMENLQFQVVVRDQKTAMNALNAAYDKLQSFYAKRQTFLQQQANIPNAQHYANQARESAGAAPEFQDHTVHENSNHVLVLIKKLAGDAQVMVDESVHSEQNAQAAYETLIQETNDSVKAKSRLITDKTGELAETDQRKSYTEQEKADVDGTIKGLADSLQALHSECDFLLGNFAARQEARAAEIDALAEVKAILRGMK
eukprot:TRINITY_DN112932_c0_g1_i1.p1 TRINITY_DN112932_c0_g1~~TRINITY_DN112932_c0_g1_i1.p1  ORF type:complete len:768 (-),score=259.65 TRINITY_DN112932_c0_g1_i1:78-2282(-)